MKRCGERADFRQEMCLLVLQSRVSERGKQVVGETIHDMELISPFIIPAHRDERHPPRAIPIRFLPVLRMNAEKDFPRARIFKKRLDRIRGRNNGAFLQGAFTAFSENIRIVPRVAREYACER